MTFDSSRFTFDAWRDFLGVVMQQGRVQLDSDWNELVSQFLRRVQVGTLDTMGKTVVPRETPDGFLITVNGRQLKIGVGRMYVDGILVENHGRRGGYDLASERDRVVAIDYASTGRLDHLLLYRPGKGIAYILSNDKGAFTTVYSNGRNGIGSKDRDSNYDLAIERDRIIAFDYASTGRLDHLLLYRPGDGTVYILKKEGNDYVAVYQSGTGIGKVPDNNYDLADERDRVIAFDYEGTGRFDHLLLYRPGKDCKVYILRKDGDDFTAVYQSNNGIGKVPDNNYDLADERDRVIAFDYASTGRLDHLLLYRPGKDCKVYILKKDGDDFTAVYQSNNGIGKVPDNNYDLADERDRVIAFDYAGTGRLDHLLAYRPGEDYRTVYILKKDGDDFTAVYRSNEGIGGYDLKSERDRIIAFDYAGSGKLDHLLLYRPGKGIVYILKKGEDNKYASVYQSKKGIGGEASARGTVWDPALAELKGESIDFTAQPYYFPDTPELPVASPFLVYLDVWQREVTHLQYPELVEKAVGVDTTGRLQTVWQVKILRELDASLTCESVASWDNWTTLIRPSGARLSTRIGLVSGTPDPCQIPPSGGYKGLENQLYRVEIHDGGPASEATFKWSRDNATVASRISQINPGGQSIVVETLGRDEVLSFSEGDWIEITDDVRELRGEPGVMRRIRLGSGIDIATKTIFLAEHPSGADLPNLGRNPRVRRWDQSGPVFREDGTTVHFELDSTIGGVIPVPPDGASLFLENGILVRFGLAGEGHFHTGDYWNFAARTADASIELLTDAPPRGIHHHYARLAVMDGPNRALQDCRVLWPQSVGDCCVELVARPGAGWQEIFDKIPSEQNSKNSTVICFPPGDYPLTTTVKVAGKGHLLLYGAGPATRIIGSGSSEKILEFENCTGVDIRDLYIYGGRPILDKRLGGVHLSGTLNMKEVKEVNLTGVLVRCKPGRKKGMACVRIDNGAKGREGRIKIKECNFYIGHLQIGLLITNAATIRVNDNRFVASGYNVKKSENIPHVSKFSIAAQAIVVGGERADNVLIESNEIDRAAQGIHVGLSHSTRIRTAKEADFGGRVVLSQNKVHCEVGPDVPPECHGLFVGNFHSVTIKDNYLTQGSEKIRETETDGIRVVGFAGELVHIRGNHVVGFTQPIRTIYMHWSAEPSLPVRLVAENYERGV